MCLLLLSEESMNACSRFRHNIRIHLECEDGTENSSPSDTIWHHQACRAMANGDPEEWNSEKKKGRMHL